MDYMLCYHNSKYPENLTDGNSALQKLQRGRQGSEALQEAPTRSVTALRGTLTITELLTKTT